MKFLLLIICLVMALPAVYMAPMAFMGATNGMSGRALAGILISFGLAGLYLYGLYRSYHFLRPFAEAVPNSYLWLIAALGILFCVLRRT